MNNYKSAFTIIELLVVIVVIGILAAITIISYTGISKKATEVSLQSDLSGASTKLKLYQAENGSFPTENNCSVIPAVPPKICLQSSPGNTFDYIPESSGNPQSFTLNSINDTIRYQITDATSPVPYPFWISGIAGTVLENKFVYYQNSPAGIGSDPYFKWANAVSACTAIGGRLPTITELQAIANGKVSYGNNFYISNTATYWSSTQLDSNNAWRLIFWINIYGQYSSTTTDTIGKTFNLDAARCVKG
ncbi:MAG: prepilin-type N-terminal cleavage/methylation domain-containing protein [Candidatus Saccharibacteria bacterium]